MSGDTAFKEGAMVPGRGCLSVMHFLKINGPKGTYRI